MRTTPTPPPFGPKIAALHAKRHGKKVSVTITFRGVSTAGGTLTVKLTLRKGKKTIAKGAGTVRGSKVSLTLRAKKPVRKGRYTLSISVSQAGKSAKLSKTVKLK